MAVRTVALVAPFALAVLTAIVAGRLLPVADSWSWALGRLVVIGIATVVTVLLARRALRRLGPLPALLRLSAAFPHDAPNRLRLALQMPSARHLERALRGEAVGQRLAASDGNVAARIVALTTAISAHHPRTRGHSERVRAYADLIGQELGLHDDDLERLRWAALLHDVGKLDVPVEILDKPDRPDAREWAVLAAHPASSARLTEPLRGWLGPWWSAIGEHHERWDGTGYPGRLRANEITLAGRIVAVADSFETMTEVRSYKQSMSFAAAQQELVDSSGTHFDPAIVRAFLAISTLRIRRAAGWAAWLPGPLLELVRTIAAGFGATAGPAGVAATAAVTLLVPGVADNVLVGPTEDDRSVVTAADLVDEPGSASTTTSSTSTTLPPVAAPSTAPAVVQATEPEVPAPAPVTATTSPASSTDASTSTSAPPTTLISDTGTTRPPEQGTSTPPTTSAVDPASASTSTVAVAPPTTPPPPTAPPVTTTAPPVTTVTSTTTVATTPTTSPAPEWVGSPSFSAAGQTVFATGIQVEGWGLPVVCTLILVDAPGFVPVAVPCANLMSVLAPEPSTTYAVRLEASTSAGSAPPITGSVTTGE